MEQVAREAAEDKADDPATRFFSDAVNGFASAILGPVGDLDEFGDKKRFPVWVSNGDLSVGCPDRWLRQEAVSIAFLYIYVFVCLRLDVWE